MPKEKQNPQKFPPKQITQVGGATVEFKKVNDDFPSALYVYPESGGYQELFPSVYSIKIPGEGFTRIYDFFADEYFENRGLINYAQFCLYNYISTLRNRGYYLSIHSRKGKNDGDNDVIGLAKMVGIKPDTLTAHLDHLENCLLIHRVRRLDLHGTPNELVIHSPFTAQQLDHEGKQKIIVNRVARNHVQNDRQKAVIKGDGKNGGFGYLNRKMTNERFQMNYKAVKTAFGEAARQFCNFALEFFKANLQMLRDSKSSFDYAYRAELNKKFTTWAIGGNTAREKCYIAANKFRVIYCPTDEEICA